MIPAPPGHVAVIKYTLGNGEEVAARYPVVAWNNDGEPLILLAGDEHELRRARDVAGYSHIDEATPIVAAVPGGGWIAHRGARQTPVIAWAINANGQAIPITNDPNDVPSTEGWTEYELRHPAERTDPWKVGQPRPRDQPSAAHVSGQVSERPDYAISPAQRDDAM